MHGQGGAWSLVCGLWAPGDPQFHRSLPVACGALSRATALFPSCSWELDMENEYKNEYLTEGKPKLLRMNGARTKRYRHLLRKGLPMEEAIEKSKYPIDHQDDKAICSTSNEPSRRHHLEEQNTSEMPSHGLVCKLSYLELKNMSSMLPNAKLRSRFYYQTRVLGIDPDQSFKALLADSTTEHGLDDDELIAHESGRSLTNETTRPSTSRQHNTLSGHRTPSKASRRSMGESRSFTEQCERIPNNSSSFGTSCLGLPDKASSSHLTWDCDRVPFNMEEPYYCDDQPPRHKRSYSGSEQEQQDFRESHTVYPSKFSLASTSQMAWNEDNFPIAQNDIEESYDDKYESSRRDQSHFGSELDKEDFSVNYGPRYDTSYPNSELDWKDFRDLRDPPRWDRAHPDSESDQSHFRGSYDRCRAGSEQDQHDFDDDYGPAQWERSHPDLELDQVDLRELLRHNRSHAPSRDRYRDGSAEDGKNLSDKYDPLRRDSFRRGSELDHEHKYDLSSQRQCRSCHSSEVNQKGSRERHDPPRRVRSPLGSEADRKGSRERYDPQRRNRSRRISEDNWKDSRKRAYDRPRRYRSHRRSEPDRIDSRNSPREQRPPVDRQSSIALKKEDESFLRNLKWSPPQINTATETTDDQPDRSSTRKRKLSTQVDQPSLVVIRDLVPLVTPILPGLPIKRPRLDQDAINRGISSLMDPSRWTAPNEGMPEEVQAWKEDYQRFLADESWKQDYKRFLENNKTGTTSNVSHHQTSGNNSGHSREFHQPESEPSHTQKRKEHDDSKQPKTESTREPRTYRNQAERTSPGSGQDQVKKTPSSQKNHRRQVRRMLANSLQDDQMRPALFKNPITAGSQSTREQDNLPRRNRKDPGSSRQPSCGSSSSRMAFPKRSTAEETKDPSPPVFIVPKNFPKERLSAEQMDAIESNILEAILEINDKNMKPSFKESFRRNGKYGVLCNDRFSNDWLYKHIQMNEPWPKASLKIVTAESTQVRVSVKLPLCKNDDNERILKFIIKQNPNLDAKGWTVFHRLDSDTSTSVMFLVEEDSVGEIRNCGKINFKIGRAEVFVEGDSEVKSGPSGAGLSSGASRVGTTPSNCTERINPVNTVRGCLGPRGMPQPMNENLPNMLDSSFRLAENNMELSSPRGHSGFSDPLRLPSVRNPHMQHSGLPELPGPRDHPTLLNPCGDPPVYCGDPKHPYFGERSGLFTPSVDQPDPNPYEEQLGYFEPSLKSQPFPSLHDYPQQMLEPPFLGDALVEGNRVPSGRAERSLPEPSSSRSSRPYRTSRPD